MLSYITFPVRILIAALLLGNATSNLTAAPLLCPLAINENQIAITIESQFQTDSGTFYEATLTNNATAKELGRVVFSFNKFTKSGYIARLHVLREERKNSYGSSLLKFALKKLTDLHCNAIYWHAFPFDLYTHQTSESMLPKLIAFYQRHGAQVLSQTESSAQMAYYPAATCPIQVA